METITGLLQGYTPILIFIFICFAALLVMFLRTMRSMESLVKRLEDSKKTVDGDLTTIRRQLEELIQFQARTGHALSRLSESFPGEEIGVEKAVEAGAVLAAEPEPPSLKAPAGEEPLKPPVAPVPEEEEPLITFEEEAAPGEIDLEAEEGEAKPGPAPGPEEDLAGLLGKGEEEETLSLLDEGLADQEAPLLDETLETEPDFDLAGPEPPRPAKEEGAGAVEEAGLFGELEEMADLGAPDLDRELMEPSAPGTDQDEAGIRFMEEEVEGGEERDLLDLASGPGVAGELDETLLLSDAGLDETMDFFSESPQAEDIGGPEPPEPAMAPPEIPPKVPFDEEPTIEFDLGAEQEEAEPFETEETMPPPPDFKPDMDLGGEAGPEFELAPEQAPEFDFELSMDREEEDAGPAVSTEARPPLEEMERPDEVPASAKTGGAGLFGPDEEEELTVEDISFDDDIDFDQGTPTEDDLKSLYDETIDMDEAEAAEGGLFFEEGDETPLDLLERDIEEQKGAEDLTMTFELEEPPAREAGAEQPLGEGAQADSEGKKPSKKGNITDFIIEDE